MSHPRETEICDSDIKPISYSEMQDWLASQPDDFTDKVATLVNKNGENEPINLDRSPDNPAERRKPGTELLARYLHYLHKFGNLNIFETIYSEKFGALKADYIPVPIDGASVVYLCINSAEDFAEFLVRSQSVDFDGLPPDAGKIKEILAIITDPIRQTADDILSEFPFLNGLKISADFNEIEEYMSVSPVVSTEDMVKLIEYLKFLATRDRNRSWWEGAGKRDLTELENFVHNLEQMIIKRFIYILSRVPEKTKSHELATIMANEKFFKYVDATYHNPEQTKRALKALPERSHINKPSVIRTTIRNFIQDLYEVVGKPKEGDGPITKTFKDALRALAGKKDE